MSTLNGRFQLNRLTPPEVFYTPKPGRHGHDVIPGVTVLAIDGTHETPGYLTVGYVSKQTPFGQGISMGMRKDTLRPATPDEILRALASDHPHGAQYRPGCVEVEHMALTDTTLTQVGRRPRRESSKVPLPTRRTSITVRTTASVYQKIMANWDAITHQQISAILRTLGC